VIAHLKTRGIAIEQGALQRVGANGPGTSVHLSDPDDSLTELMLYGDPQNG
jgi:hypothetical protein